MKKEELNKLTKDQIIDKFEALSEELNAQVEFNKEIQAALEAKHTGNSNDVIAEYKGKQYRVKAGVIIADLGKFSKQELAANPQALKALIESGSFDENLELLN